MRTPKKDIDAYLQSLFACIGDLKPVVLTPKERRVMGGHIFTEAPYLIRRLAAGLLESPNLFAHVPVSGQELLDHQERACAWRDLRNHLSWLAQIANDGYLSEQSAAIDKMAQVIAQMEIEAQSPFPTDPLACERRFALAAFFLLLQRRQERIQKKIRRVRRRRAAQEKSGGDR